jgi:hypothetical protein
VEALVLYLNGNSLLASRLWPIASQSAEACRGGQMVAALERAGLYPGKHGDRLTTGISIPVESVAKSLKSM